MYKKKVSLQDLEDQLREADAALELAKKAKEAINNEIMAHPEVRSVLKEDGQTTVGRFQITTGWYRHWDNDGLEELQDQVKAEFFPFKRKVTFTEDRRFTRDIEAKWPKLWEKISTALTLTPKTPVIKLKETEDNA